MSRLCALLLLVLAMTPAAGAPLAFNEAALARGFALPALGRMALAEPAALEQQLGLALINEFALFDLGTEFLEADGETVRIAWHAAWGVAPGWEVGVTVPFYFQGGGFMDSPIENWHEWFGLPNANRHLRAHDRYRYVYRRDAATLLDLPEGRDGVGDLRVEAARVIIEGTALRAQLKLPTGDAAKLTGNDAGGGALWLDWALPIDAVSRWQGYLSGGLSYTADGDVLAPLQKNFVAFGGAGLSVDLFSRLAALVQAGVHGPLYENSAVSALTKTAVPLAFGFSWGLTPTTTLDFLIQEDAATYASPDFVLHLGLAMR